MQRWRRGDVQRVNAANCGRCVVFVRRRGDGSRSGSRSLPRPRARPITNSPTYTMMVYADDDDDARSSSHSPCGVFGKSQTSANDILISQRSDGGGQFEGTLVGRNFFAAKFNIYVYLLLCRRQKRVTVSNVCIYAIFTLTLITRHSPESKLFAAHSTFPAYFFVFLVLNRMQMIAYVMIAHLVNDGNQKCMCEYSNLFATMRSSVCAHSLAIYLCIRPIPSAIVPQKKTQHTSRNTMSAHLNTPPVRNHTNTYAVRANDV